MSAVKITYEPEWRRTIWESDIPSRPAWFVTCPDHPQLGKDHDGKPWGYATSGRAYGVATRHQRTKHQPGP
jgi:hypothetical protein